MRHPTCGCALELLLLIALAPLTASGTPDTWAQELLAEARSPELQQYMVAVRRQLHREPELGFQEHVSSGLVQQQLEELGIPFFTLAGTGISALIGDGSPPLIALRADLDALPLNEPQHLAAGQQGFSSLNPGRMHACGHDAHSAMLLGAARLLASRRSRPGGCGANSSSWGGAAGGSVGVAPPAGVAQGGAEGAATGCQPDPSGGWLSGLQGSVVLVWQPAEEGGGGGRQVVEAGGLRGATAAAALHVWPGLTRGRLGSRRGVIMAASDRFAFKVQGQGGHAAMPHLAVDPVVAAAAVVLALQPVVSRETAPTDGAVISVSRLNTGPGAANVIPDSVELQGTIRALSLATFERLRRRVAEVANLTAATYGCSITDLQWSATPYPPTVNDAGMADLALAVAASLGAASRAMGDAQEWGDVGAEDLAEPSMAAEDFAFYAAKVPSVMTWLGIGDAALGTDVSLHNPHFQMDESQLALGSAWHATLALAYLQQHQHLAPGLQPEGRSGPQLQPGLAVDTLVASQQRAGHADLSSRPIPQAISPLQQHDDL
ncbi:hypothetical protein V8C86DRAFT_2531108 [Haematococcus lacustris]